MLIHTYPCMILTYYCRCCTCMARFAASSSSIVAAAQFLLKHAANIVYYLVSITSTWLNKTGSLQACIREWSIRVYIHTCRTALCNNCRHELVPLVLLNVIILAQTTNKLFLYKTSREGRGAGNTAVCAYLCPYIHVLCCRSAGRSLACCSLPVCEGSEKQWCTTYTL